MAETKKPAAKSAAVKKTTAASKPATTKAAPAKAAAPKAAAPAEAKPAAKKVSKGNKKPAATTRLQDKYNNEIKKALMEKFHYSSIMECPRLEKVVQDMFKKYPVVSEANALKYLKNCEDDEISRYYYAYVSENMRRDQNELKNKFRDDIKIYQKRKNLSNYKICKLTNTDPGNFHSFYELNKNDKLSVKKLRTILNVCIKY